jgi:hypothetical protein
VLLPPGLTLLGEPSLGDSAHFVGRLAAEGTKNKRR